MGPPGHGAENRPAREVREWQQLQGRRLRVSLPERDSTAVVEGVLLRASGDTLFLTVEGSAAPVSLLTSHRTEVEEWRRSDPTGSMTVLGGLLGSVAGVVVADLINDPPPPQRCGKSSDTIGGALGCSIGADIATAVDRTADRFTALMAGMLVGAVIGGAVGHQIGKASITEGWRRVRRPVLTAMPTSGGRVRLTVRIAL